MPFAQPFAPFGFRPPGVRAARPNCPSYYPIQCAYRAGNGAGFYRRKKSGAGPRGGENARTGFSVHTAFLVQNNITKTRPDDNRGATLADRAPDARFADAAAEGYRAPGAHIKVADIAIHGACRLDGVAAARADADAAAAGTEPDAGASVTDLAFELVA